MRSVPILKFSSVEDAVRRAMPSARQQAVVIQDLVQEMERLDSGLTAAVRLAAVTGDARWSRDSMAAGW